MRLATWNVLNGTSLHDGVVDAARLQRAAAQLRPDVLGLQEVDRGQPRSHDLDLVREVAEGLGAAAWRFAPTLIGMPGLDWRAADDGDDAAPRAYGIGLVSMHPVRSWHLLRLPAARVRSPVPVPGTRRVVWLRDEPRAAVAAVVDAPLGTITVAATHLSFVPGYNLLQLRRVTRWLQQLPGPHVLVGDLNMPALAISAVPGWRGLGQLATFPAPQPRVQLDHVLSDGGLPAVQSVEAPVVPVSDHRPLVVQVGGAR